MTTPNLKEIEWAISELENSETREERYVLLAALYICRDQLRAKRSEDRPAHPAAQAAGAPAEKAEPRQSYGDSDFLRVVSQKDPAHAWRVMDELMETLHIVEPRVYNSVMRKLGA